MHIRARLVATIFCLAFLSASPAAFAQQGLSGLYVRGDLGGAFGAGTTFKDSNPTAANCILCTTTLPTSTGNSVMFGGGVGYRFTPVLRADLTLDYMPQFNAHGTNSTGSASVTFNTFVGLVNGYVDLNGLMPTAFGPFQPYLTAGIGMSRNSMGTAAGRAFGVSGTQSGATNTDLAWAIGAGVAYPINQNLTFDVGYKYLDLGELHTGTTNTAAGVTTTSTVQKANLQAHTVTAGLRWGF